MIGWRYIPAIAVYCVICSLFIVYLAWASAPEVVWMFTGFAGGVSLLLLYIATETVAANRLESAAIAESNTSSEVRKLHRKGWRVIDNLPFHKLDVDHIAIGPGGIVVLETKWTSDGLTDAKGQLNRYGEKAIRQVSENVNRINTVLRQNGCDATVGHACVVSWGTRSLGTPLVEAQQGVTVIDGDELRGFLGNMRQVMSDATIEAAFNAINQFLGVRLERIAQEGSLRSPRSSNGAR
jgi:hypothetical protein